MPSLIKGGEAKGDECSLVGWILSPFEARRNQRLVEDIVQEEIDK